MTKGEQARLLAWRLKVLRLAADEQNVARVCRRFGISRKSFYKWKRRHAEHGDAGSVIDHEHRSDRLEPRLWRWSARSSISASTITSAPGGSPRIRTDSMACDRALLSTPDPQATRDASAAGEPKASAAWEALAALRETAAWSPIAARCESSSSASPVRVGGCINFTAIDDCTRIRVLKVYDACTQRTAIAFIDDVMHRLPFRVLVVQTDNGAEFQSQFHWHVEERDIRHVYIRPHTPRLNGKVERSHRVDDQEFYQLLDKDGITDDIRSCSTTSCASGGLLQLPPPHGALGGQTPYERLLAKTRANVSPKVADLTRWSWRPQREPDGCGQLSGRALSQRSADPAIRRAEIRQTCREMRFGERQRYRLTEAQKSTTPAWRPALFCCLITCPDVSICEIVLDISHDRLKLVARFLS